MRADGHVREQYYVYDFAGFYLICCLLLPRSLPTDLEKSQIRFLSKISFEISRHPRLCVCVFNLSDWVEPLPVSATRTFPVFAHTIRYYGACAQAIYVRCPSYIVNNTIIYDRPSCPSLPTQKRKEIREQTNGKYENARGKIRFTKIAFDRPTMVIEKYIYSECKKYLYTLLFKTNNQFFL